MYRIYNNVYGYGTIVKFEDLNAIVNFEKHTDDISIGLCTMGEIWEVLEIQQ